MPLNKFLFITFFIWNVPGCLTMYMVFSIHQKPELLNRQVSSWNSPCLHVTLATLNGITRKWESIVLAFYLVVISEGFSFCLCGNFNMQPIQGPWSRYKVYKGFSSDSNTALTKESKAGWHQFSLRNKLRHRRDLHEFFKGTLGRRDWTPGDLTPFTPTWALQAFLFPVKWEQAFPWRSWHSVKGTS